MGNHFPFNGSNRWNSCSVRVLCWSVRARLHECLWRAKHAEPRDTKRSSGRAFRHEMPETKRIGSLLVSPFRKVAETSIDSIRRRTLLVPFHLNGFRRRCSADRHELDGRNSKSNVELIFVDLSREVPIGENLFQRSLLAAIVCYVGAISSDAHGKNLAILRTSYIALSFAQMIESGIWMDERIEIRIILFSAFSIHLWTVICATTVFVLFDVGPFE